MSPALLQSLGEHHANIVLHSENLLAGYAPYDLHQFRVNIRRTRSLLKRLHTRPARFFLESWSEFFAVTGPARDLDVFLVSAMEILDEEQYNRFEEMLRPLVQASHEAAREMLRSWPWKNHLAGWRGFLKIQDKRPQETPHGRLSKVKKRALKRCRKALHKGSDRDWHKLRIAVKNLRYVSDASRNDPGADEAALEALVNECKELQTLLGDWHDTIVQLQMIAGPELPALFARTPELTEVGDLLQREIAQRKARLLEQTTEFIAEHALFSKASGSNLN